MSEQFFMTTAHSLEGYAIVEQLGIVFGETVFKNSALDQLGAGISNAIESLRFRAAEMSGSVNLIENARSFAYNKLIDEAKKKGANAVIAIDSDNTIGNGIMYISLYGTAVKVVPLSEKEGYEQIKKQQEKEKIKKIEDAKEGLIERLKAATGKDSFTDEEFFLASIAGFTSVADIWEAWNSYSLSAKYPDVDQYINGQKDTEALYGGVDTEKLINDIRGWILKE